MLTICPEIVPKLAEIIRFFRDTIMALKFEIIGNNLVVTDTADSTVKLERPAADVFGLCEANQYKILTRAQRNDELLKGDYSNLVDSSGAALDAASLRSFFRSNLAFNSAGSAASTTSKKLSPPYGFPINLPYNIYRLSRGDVVTDFDPLAMIPVPTKTYSVDLVNGNDLNAGTDAAPLKNISTALSKADVDQVKIINLTADFIAVGAAGWNNTSNQGRSISLVNNTGKRVICVPSGLVVWARNATYNQVFEVTTSTPYAIDITNYEDLSGGSLTGIVTHTKRRYIAMKRVASIAAVAAQSNTYFHDGTKLYVRPFNDRDLVANNAGMYRGPAGTNNGRLTPTASNLNFYISNIDFVGGITSFLAIADSATITGTTITFDNCSFQASATGNAYSLKMSGTVYLWQCATFDGWSDGFNYHSYLSNGTNDPTSPVCHEFYGISKGCGSTGAAPASNNASTSHDGVKLIVIEPNYINSNDRVFAHTDYANVWGIGGKVGQALQTGAGKESIAALQNVKMWIDSMQALDGTNTKWIAAQNATIKHFNVGNVVNAGTGEATGKISGYFA